MASGKPGYPEECDAARTAATRAMCEQKKKMSQSKLDFVHTKTRDMLRKIDTYRRKEAGLPPPEWWQDTPKTPAYNSTGGGTPKADAPLLPNSSTPLPANTF